MHTTSLNENDGKDSEIFPTIARQLDHSMVTECCILNRNYFWKIYMKHFETTFLAFLYDTEGKAD